MHEVGRVSRQTLTYDQVLPELLIWIDVGVFVVLEVIPEVFVKYWASTGHYFKLHVIAGKTIVGIKAESCLDRFFTYDLTSQYCNLGANDIAVLIFGLVEAVCDLQL